MQPTLDVSTSQALLSRRRFNRILATATGLTVLGRRMGAAEPEALRPAVDLRVMLDLEIHRYANRTLKMDLWLPRRATRAAPLVVYVHGGGWREGTQYRPPFRPRLFDHGIGIAALTYRFAQEAPFPAMLHDCKLGVRWLRAHARELAIDPDRFSLWGISAGGHLTSLMGVTNGMPEWEGDGPWREFSSAVSAVCSWCGPTDLVRPLQERASGMNAAMLEPVIGGPLESHRANAEAASALYHLRQRRPENLPSFLLVHGGRDELVPPYHSVAFHEALRARGAQADLLLMPELGHTLNHPDVAARTETFLRRHLQ